MLKLVKTRRAKWVVRMPIRGTVDIRVEADSEASALEAANKLALANDFDHSLLQVYGTGNALVIRDTTGEPQEPWDPGPRPDPTKF